jgi:hypothetical protein
MQAGKTAAQAVSVLDKGSEGESERERKMRLLLRHRFLAAISNKPKPSRQSGAILQLGRKLLSLWGIPIANQTSKKQKRKSDAGSSTIKKKKQRVSLNSIGIGIPRQSSHNRKTWLRHERVAFLKGLEVHRVGNWKEIAPYVPSRYVPVEFVQVRCIASPARKNLLLLHSRSSV